MIESTKSVGLYQRAGHWFFQTSSMLPGGLWIATPPIVQIDATDSLDVKGKAALEALRASRQNIPVPADTRNVIAPLLESAGVKSWSAFIRTAKHVILKQEGETLTITPSEKMPSRRTVLLGLSGQSVVISAQAAHKEIGAAIEEALARSE